MNGAGVDVEALARVLEERLAPARLTPAELAEAICIALAVPPELSAAARRVSVAAVRERRSRIRSKLEPLRRAAALAGGPPGAPGTLAAPATRAPAAGQPAPRTARGTRGRPRPS